MAVQNVTGQRKCKSFDFTLKCYKVIIKALAFYKVKMKFEKELFIFKTVNHARCEMLGRCLQIDAKFPCPLLTRTIPIHQSLLVIYKVNFVSTKDSKRQELNLIW